MRFPGSTMTKTSIHRLAAAMTLAVLAVGISTSTAEAQLFWTTNGTSGNWTTSSFWGTSAGGPFDQSWTGGSDAAFTANSTLSFTTGTSFGNVTVSDGITVTVSQAGTAPAAARIIDVGTGSTLNWASQNYTASGTSFTKNGTGMWNLGSISNAYTGGMTLNAGTVLVTGTNSFGGSSATLTINGGTIQTSGAPTFAVGQINVNSDFGLTGTAGAWIMTGAIDLGSATRTITLTADGVKTMSGNISGGVGAGFILAGTGNLTLSGVNSTYTGGTTVSGGTLSMGSAGALGSSTSPLTVNSGGRLDMGSHNLTVGNLTGTGGTINGTSGSRLLTIGNGDAGGGNFLGVIADGSGGTTALTKTGSGMITLSGNNTYTGTTTISQGTLALGVNGEIANSSVINVEAGGTFNVDLVSGGFELGGSQTLAGSGSIVGPLSVLGTIAPGSSPGTLTLDDNLTLGGSSTLSFELDASNQTVGGGINDLITGVADLVLDGTLDVASVDPLGVGTWRLINYTGSLTDSGLDIGAINLEVGHSASIVAGGGVVNIQVVPEPSTLALLGGVSVVGLLIYRRRCKA